MRGLKRRRVGSKRGKVGVMEIKGKEGKVGKEEAARAIQMCTMLTTPKSLFRALSFTTLVTPNACLASLLEV